MGGHRSGGTELVSVSVHVNACELFKVCECPIIVFHTRTQNGKLQTESKHSIQTLATRMWMLKPQGGRLIIRVT